MRNDCYDLDTGTLVPYIQLFREHLNSNLTKTALACGEQIMTYEELDKRSNRVAAYLQREGVTPRSVIGLFMKRTMDLPVALLGIMKIGAAFLPLDPQFPPNRIRHLVQDSCCERIIVHRSLRPELTYYEDLIDYEEMGLADEAELQPAMINLDETAYLLYTSGSTGLPKGTVISQEALASFVYGITAEIGFRDGASMLFLTTISFDISLLELLVPLLFGMRVVIADEREQRNPYLLKKMIIEKKIDMIQMTPSAMQLLLNYDKELICLRNVTDVLLGGEALPLPVLEEIRTHTDANIYNLYGPTESTIWCMAANLKGLNTVILGKAFRSVTVYVLSPDMQQVEPGCVGELYIGGPQVAKGYLNQPQLTAEKFKRNPYKEGGIIFKTGDLVRLTEEETLLFQGRNDHQVKIRGFRIEPSEIEAAFLKQDVILHAAVVPKMGLQGHAYLCAYYISPEPVDERQLISHLRKELPGYMIPEQLIRLEEMPYTPNFKIDRKVLMNMDNLKIPLLMQSFIHNEGEMA